MKHKFPGKLSAIQEVLKKLHLPSKIIFLAMGILSTAWFLVRVIPKPVRATYPCMQAAAPIMSAFILYLIGLGTSVFAFRKSGKLFRKNRFVAAGLLLLVASVSLVAVSLLGPGNSVAREMGMSAGDYPPNEPMGEALGIFPGRVVWVHDVGATNENCTNTFNKDGKVDDLDDVYYLDKNTFQDSVDLMLDAALLHLTGEENLPDAWDAVFKWFNNTKKSKGEVGYQAGEKVLIKVNRTSESVGLNADFSRNDKKSYQNLSETSPQIMMSVLRHLVYHAGVPQENIYIGDPQRDLFKGDLDKLSAVFPDVHYLGSTDEYGRTQVTGVTSGKLYFAGYPETITEKPSDGLYTIYWEADYLITLPALKGHSGGGITACTKNHFGSQSNNSASYLHPGLEPYQRGKYKILTDIMASRYLGQNTLICIVDAMWMGSSWNGVPHKFKMEPFDGDFPSSILVSLDHVAIESVGFDILRTEYTAENGYSNTFPNYGAVDDFLHQAADSANWPDGIVYDPDNTGQLFASLGVHEHWNSADQRQYSRNLGSGDGIELVYVNLVDVSSGTTPVIRELTLDVYPNPADMQCRIVFNDTYRGIVTIALFNPAGQLISSEKAAKSVERFDYSMNISDLASGTYLVRVSGGNRQYSGRILVR